MKQTFVITFDPVAMNFNVSSNSIKMKRGVSFAETVSVIATTLKLGDGKELSELDQFIIKASEEQPAESQPEPAKQDEETPGVGVGTPETTPTVEPGTESAEPVKDLTGAALPIPEPPPPVVAVPRTIEAEKESDTPEVVAATS